MDEITRKTGVIYCRVSSAEQVQGTSLAMQEERCKEYAERENIEVVAVFVEEGESAKTADRTEFKKALNFCSDKKKPVDFFIVHKLDRFARNKDDHVMTQMFLRRYGTKLRSVTEQIDETPVGKLMEGVLSTFAQFDNDVRAYRSKSGMVEKVKRGVWVWAPPLGYKRLYKGANLSIDETVAPHIRKVFEEYAGGNHTFRSLAELMAKEGMKTRQGKKPCMQLIEKILRNPAYYGLIRAFSLEVTADFPALVTEDLFWKCQPGGRKGHSGRRYSDNSMFPLRRFATCSSCGKSLTGSASTGRKGKKYPYYHHHKQGCPAAVAIPKETLEQNFAEFLEDLSPNTKSEKAFRLVVADVWKASLKKLDTDNEGLRREVRRLEDERQKIFDLHLTGKYTDDEFLEQKRKVTSTIHEKKRLLEEKHVEEFNIDEALEYCFDFVRHSGKTWQRLAHTPALRSRFQKSVFPEKVEFDGKKFGTKKMSLVYELNQPNADKDSTLVTPPGIEPGLTA